MLLDPTQECLVVFFSAPDASDRAMEFVGHLKGLDEVGDMMVCDPIPLPPPCFQVTIATTREIKLRGDAMSVLFNEHPAPPANTAEGEANFITEALEISVMGI